ncbi:nucleoside triphosphate pyrophosphatase [Pilimelia columellifera]|uniref:Nucleoside triphosphate pyrophosphatase n=1 Tax=Pilimelia columellifera subsp. columellifera TaxID=706583 RepID=A0ABP6AUZ0_9ACTN
MTNSSPVLVLASASPARHRLLAEAGIDVEVIVSGVDESTVPDTDPVSVSGELARLKAAAVTDRLRAEGRADGPGRTLVLGCDSVLDFDGAILGKPRDAAEATERWRRMRGRSGVLHTGHSLVDLASGRVVTEVAGTTVFFADVTDAEIDAYVATGEPLHVAGSFTIDGLASPFIERIDGDHGTVVGLSMPLLRKMLAELGTPVTALWRQAGR